MFRKSSAVLSALVLSLLLPVLTEAGVEKYAVDPGHSEVGFAVRHFVAKVAGRFDKFEGEISIDPEDHTAFSFTGKIDASSINTNNEERDNHLRSPDFFGAKENPQITFRSKKVSRNRDTLKVTGDLTIRGVTQEVTLDVEVLGFGPDAWGGHRAGFEAHGKINRKAFGMQWNKKLDQGGLVLGDDVELTLRIEAVRH
ncbi:MAG: YceI family protein [Candidatus Krumholzibacteriia bacterium]